MGFHIESSKSPRHAPTWCFNHCGSLPWGGLHENQIDSSTLFDIVEFCIEEAFRRGLNDSHNKQIDFDSDQVFPRAFLGGLPVALWRHYYRLGNSKAAEENINWATALNPTTDEIAELWRREFPDFDTRFWRRILDAECTYFNSRTPCSRQSRKNRIQKTLSLHRREILEAIPLGNIWSMRCQS